MSYPQQVLTSSRPESLRGSKPAFNIRLAPFHKYTSLRNISLSLPQLPVFRTHMYCNIDANGQHGPATFQVRDTRSYRMARPMANVSCVGMVREAEAVESLRGPGDVFSSVRSVRPAIRCLAFATQAFGANSGGVMVPEPSDMRPCLAYVGSVRTKSSSILHVRTRVFHPT